MDEQRTSLAKSCLEASHDGTMSFPAIIGALLAAGFEGYTVDYRRGVIVYFHSDGDSVVLENPVAAGSVALRFDAETIAAQVRWAQADPPDYSYRAFSANVTAAGCAGYMVSFPGRRVLYFGRTAETHVELFP